VPADGDGGARLRRGHGGAGAEGLRHHAAGAEPRRDPGHTSTETLADWTEYFGLSGPVLGDRGWGYNVLGSYVGIDTFAYPTWAVVTPDLQVISVGTGYGDGPLG
jgi:hypothetical protein